MNKILDNLIIGTGLSGLAAARAFQRQNSAFAVLDVGFDLEPERVMQVNAQREDWDEQTAHHLFAIAQSSYRGVERRNSFGSTFPYDLPQQLKVTKLGCAADMSHGLGGFANVWGAAMMPYSVQSLAEWPDMGGIQRSYANVLEYVPLSFSVDDLAQHFPTYAKASHSIRPSEQTDAILQFMMRRKAQLNNDGITYGRARLAVDNSCRYCGYCLEGCVYGSIFNARDQWQKIDARIHSGFYVQEFKEFKEFVTVKAVHVKDGSILELKTKKLFLASGYLGTTRLVASSLGRFNEKIRIADSQYFFFPFFSYSRSKEKAQFTLAEIFLEILHPKISSDYMHFQIYGQNRIFSNILRWSQLFERMYLVQGFLHSKDSGHMEMTVLPRQNNVDEIVLEGVLNPRSKIIARQMRKLLASHFMRFGVVAPTTQVVPPGRSFHGGGSFPMGGRDPIYSSDRLGRPAGLQRVHIVDSANFPSIASSTLAFTMMANADRIARASLEL